MRDSIAETTGNARPTHGTAPLPATDISGLPTLADWLEGQSPGLAEHWSNEVLRRSAVSDPAMRGLLREFIRFLTSLVPAAVRGDRSPMSDVWKRTAALYGSLGALRGLAAGEVVEEFQILRAGILRAVFSDSPVLIGAELKLREALLINRWVDDGVTQASINHTDDLFFQLLEGSGVPGAPTPELLTEIRAQLDSLVEEADRLRASE